MLHFHAVSFQPGCLNDFDSGPCSEADALELNTASARDYLDNGWTLDGTPYRYQTITPMGYVGPVLKVEECSEECEEGWSL